MGSKLEQQFDAAFQKELYRSLATWQALADLMEVGMADETIIKEIRVQGPAHTGGGFRAIIKGAVGREAVVAFHNAETPRDLLAGVVARAHSDGLKWQVDAPYVPRQPRKESDAPGA